MKSERETSNGGQAWWLDRRSFLKTGAFLGGSALPADFAYPLAKPQNILYSVCLQCNTGCGIKAKIVDGVVVKIDGNPFDPMNLTPHLPYKTSPFDTATYDAILCPRGQAGLQTAYDPYRIVKVLKRAGKRGENKWVSIPFEQAVKEIVEGGYLFKNVPGGETRKVEGLKNLWALRDPKLAKALAEDAKAVQSKKVTVAEFKAKHAEHLGLLIDPEHPDLGPRNNQFVFAWGRLKAGRGDLISRFTREAFGSVNAPGPTTAPHGSPSFSAH